MIYGTCKWNWVRGFEYLKKTEKKQRNMKLTSTSAIKVAFDLSFWAQSNGKGTTQEGNTCYLSSPCLFSQCVCGNGGGGEGCAWSQL